MCNRYITEDVANQMIATLLYLRNDDRSKPITLYCNFPGGLLRPSMALYDTLEECKKDCTVSTLNLGMATGMGAFICAAGTKGKR